MVHPAERNRQPGRKLDRYELIAEIASGGMGTVYLARLEGVGGFSRLFAIKLMHPHLAKDPQFIAMLLDEARLAARIHHPNAVSIVDVCESDVGYYLVMDYIEGFTLDDVIDHPEITPEERVRLSLRILYDGAVGLHAAHELTNDSGDHLGLVHRDVSPQNILVGVDGVGRITDFGVARAAARITTSRPGMIKGKPCYMAPEQALGRDIDRRADVFALGIILWEILVGRMLFYSEAGDAAMLARVLHDEIESPRKYNEAVTEELEAVAMKALDRDPVARYQTAREFAEALLDVARPAGLMASNHELGDRLKETFRDDVKQRRASIQKHIEELGQRDQVASDVFAQVPRLEQRPSYLAIETGDGGWHEKSGATHASKPDSGAKSSGVRPSEHPVSGVAQTIIADSGAPPAQPAAPAAARRQPSTTLMGFAGVLLLLFGIGAWVLASSSSAETETETETETATATETETETATATETETETETATETATETETETETETATEVEASSDRPRMRRPPRTTMSTMTPEMGVVVESNPYLR